MLLQCAWYMALLDDEGWDVALLLGGQSLRVYHVARNRELEALMLEQAERFWHEHVLAGRPPEPDPGRDGAALARLFSAPAKQIVEVAPEEGELIETIEELHQLDRACRDLQAETERRRTGIKARIGDRLGLRGRLPDGRAFEVVWRPFKGSSYRITRDPGRSFKLTVKESA